jgi:hypothetical protein
MTRWNTLLLIITQAALNLAMLALLARVLK